MKKVLFELKSFIAKFIWGGLATLFVCGLLSCEVGLGETVDSEPPSVAITYPPEQAVIRGTFVAAGTCTDDKGVKAVHVTIYSPSNENLSYGPFEATISNGKTWQINLNEYDTEKYAQYNGYQIPDGTYTIKVTVEDNAGRTAETPATQTVDIDNTAPIFIISNPGVVKNGSSTASAYGSIFTIDGTISDDHTVSSMDVTIYDSNGDIVSKETYDGEEINSFHEDDIATAGGTSVTIAQYGSTTSTTDTRYSRYSTLHSSDEGTENYTCSIKLTDSAKEYTTPNESTNTTTGNETYALYLYDDVYTKLMSSKKGLGLSAADLKNIINGTSTNESAKTILDEKIINTQGKNDSSNLYFSLNPQANPTYQVNGFAYNFDENGTL